MISGCLHRRRRNRKASGSGSGAGTPQTPAAGQRRRDGCARGETGQAPAGEVGGCGTAWGIKSVGGRTPAGAGDRRAQDPTLCTRVLYTRPAHSSSGERWIQGHRSRGSVQQHCSIRSPITDGRVGEAPKPRHPCYLATAQPLCHLPFYRVPVYLPFLFFFIFLVSWVRLFRS